MVAPRAACRRQEANKVKKGLKHAKATAARQSLKAAKRAAAAKRKEAEAAKKKEAAAPAVGKGDADAMTE